MVDIYKAQPGEIRNESHFTLPGDTEYVLASDYAVLEAERDAWMRGCQNLLLAMRHHGYSAETLARIVEGRDNE